MTRKESLLRLRQVLIRRRDALRRTLHGELEHFNTMDDRVVGDVVDQALETDYGTINSQLAETESRELEQIEHALTRFRERRYGVCESCDRNIPLGAAEGFALCDDVHSLPQRGGVGDASQSSA